MESEYPVSYTTRKLLTLLHAGFAADDDMRALLAASTAWTACTGKAAAVSQL